ncbi:MAG: hypothetical protein ACTSPI_01320 [Candidatus Heimdallarchaeaceae archaeon]
MGWKAKDPIAWKKNISKAQKKRYENSTPWNKGKKWGEKTKQKMREAQKTKHPNVIKAKEYENLSEKEVRKLFEGWKNSTISLVSYGKELHKSPIKLKEIFKKYFNDEYQIHSDNLCCNAKRYKKGRQFEYLVMDRKRKQGFFCMRSAGSKGFADVIAIKKGRIEFIQVKMGCSMQKLEREGLIRLAESVGAIPLFIQKIGRGKIREIDAREIKQR